MYKGEPNLNPGYLKIKSVFILPHLGSATKHTRIAMANLAIDNIDEFFFLRDYIDSECQIESLIEMQKFLNEGNEKKDLHE